MPIHHIAVSNKYARNQRIKRQKIVWGHCLVSCLLFLLFLPSPVFSYDSSANDFKKYMSALEQQISRYGWTNIKPRTIAWEYYRTTKNKNPLIFTTFGNSKGNCVLFLGGVHGDELPTVYLMFKLAHYVKDNPALLKISALLLRRSSIPTVSCRLRKHESTQMALISIEISPQRTGRQKRFVNGLPRVGKSATLRVQNRHQSRKRSFKLL